MIKSNDKLVKLITQKLPGLSLFLWVLVPCLVVYFLGNSVQHWLRFDAGAIEQGEIWRLYTAHFVHLNLNHLLLNMLGLFIICALVEVPLNIKELLFWMGYFPLITGLCLWFLSPEVRWYVGFSGALHGVFLLLPFLSRYYSINAALLFALVMLLKVLWEQTDFYSDDMVGQLIEGRVVVDAHFFGTLAALPVLVYWWATGYIMGKRRRAAS